MANFLLILAALFAGYFLQKRNLFPQNAPEVLNLFVIYISLPAMILLEVPKLQLSSELLLPAMIPWVAMGGSALLLFTLSRYFRWSRTTTGAVLLTGVLGNTSFVGIPVISAYFGTEALAYVMVYDQMGSFLALSVYGSIIVALYGHGEGFNAFRIAKKIALFPPFVALVCALVLPLGEYPQPLHALLSRLADTIVPLALVAVGLQLRLRLPKSQLQPFGWALGAKLLLSPLLAAAALGLFNPSQTLYAVTVMEAAMGPMITAGALASMAGLNPRLSSAIVGYGTLLCLLTTAGVYLLV